MLLSNSENINFLFKNLALTIITSMMLALSPLILDIFIIVDLVSFKNLNRMSNSVAPEETVITSHLIWFYTVCENICFGLQG